MRFVPVINRLSTEAHPRRQPSYLLPASTSRRRSRHRPSGWCHESLPGLCPSGVLSPRGLLLVLERVPPHPGQITSRRMTARPIQNCPLRHNTSRGRANAMTRCGRWRDLRPMIPFASRLQEEIQGGGAPGSKTTRAGGQALDSDAAKAPLSRETPPDLRLAPSSPTIVTRPRV